ncbi:hypothetical protein AXG93_4519s1020 [Marchantia polymorpha subsp. ruderalis]|uniref:Uncharacterized protein n=1 Tax=Marchantia polymorpha subsp. ruderalis TaxID=1480154 RepID=A0A176WMG1_MARPO|nr:hypothetical protein AXG93_4519s1020 [Marchantia polymorpha subsp. ruderalis]
MVRKKKYAAEISAFNIEALQSIETKQIQRFNKGVWESSFSLTIICVSFGALSPVLAFPLLFGFWKTASAGNKLKVVQAELLKRSVTPPVGFVCIQGDCPTVHFRGHAS